MNQEARVLYYQLFCHYYRGDLQSTYLRGLAERSYKLLKEGQLISFIDEAAQALTMLEEINETTIQTFEYDYNRLFVGPNKLLASPYESSYRNFEGNGFATGNLESPQFLPLCGTSSGG